MTENPQQAEPALAPPLTALGKSEQLPQEPPPHAHKFRVALAMLCGIALGALAIAAAVMVHDSSTSGISRGSAAWSEWAPTDSSGTGVREIADHVAPYYRLDASKQLNVITPISVSQATAAGTTTGSGMTVAVDTTPSRSSPSLSLLNGKTIAYNICGLGPADCELPGAASSNRVLLMRRQALELALYTFKYIPDSENVLVVLPPARATKTTSTAAAGSRETIALLFVRKELEPWLNVPLSKTLATYPVEDSELAVWSKTQEASFVDEVTANGLFASQMESQQEGGRLMVLTQLPAQ